MIVDFGKRQVATDKEQHEITVGDVIRIKAERHWDGARTDTSLGHITIVFGTAIGRIAGSQSRTGAATGGDRGSGGRRASYSAAAPGQQQD